LLLLGTAPRAFADSGGVLYTFGSHLSNNESKYALYYSIPQAVRTGVKTNFTFYIYLTELSGWKYASEQQYLTITINTPSATVSTQKVNNTVFLYQGARWGPFNVTFDLSASQVGLSAGGVSNATAYANLVVFEHYDNPVYPFLVDDGATLKLSDFKITSAGTASGLDGNRLLISLGVGTGVVVALAGLVLVTKKRGASSTG